MSICSDPGDILYIFFLTLKEQKAIKVNGDVIYNLVLLHYN